MPISSRCATVAKRYSAIEPRVPTAVARTSWSRAACAREAERENWFVVSDTSWEGYTEIPRVLNGLGISILSTSKGLMKDQDCRRNKAGGELVCNVW